jgi:hypothetical protein
MAVECIKEYRQKNGEDVLKVILKLTKNFPKGYFYCDASDEELVRSYTWGLLSQKEPYVVAVIGSSYSCQTLRFHREKAHNILDYYPDYINHINGIEFDNINLNLDKVSQQQNCWSKPSKGYKIAGRSFQPLIAVNSWHKYAKRTRTEVKACISAYQLEMQYEDYRYDFLKDRRKDLNLLDMERTGQISDEEAVYHHVLRYAANNAWYVYRYNLFEYYKDNNIPIPVYAIDDEGFMTHHITGQRLCPL